MSTTAHKRKSKWWQIAIILPLFPLILAVAVVALVSYIVAGICLRIVIWSWWCPRGRDILFVYSDSPIWHDYIEQHILPYLGQRAVVLNWSQRKRWRFSLASMALRHFGGYRQLTPMIEEKGDLSALFALFRQFCFFRHKTPASGCDNTIPG